MDLLSGYGSDGSEGGASEQLHVEAPTATAPTADSRPQQADAEEAGNDMLAGKLPAPRTKTKKTVKYRVPLLVAPDSSDEEDRPKKKVKVSSKGQSLSEFLPPPKQVDTDSTEGLLGGGYGMDGKRRREVDSDEEMAAPDPFKEETVLGEGNEAYRIYDQLGDVPTAQGGFPTAQGEGGAAYPASQEYYPAQPAAGDQLLQQALQEESSKAAKNGLVADPFAGVQFKEINQTKLTYVPPEQRAEKNAVRTAFGHDYEQRIREEAGDAPEKKAKRKHQIHSLYHQAKMKELEMMELRGQAVKTKRETQAKYGWS